MPQSVPEKKMHETLVISSDIQSPCSQSVLTSKVLAHSQFWHPKSLLTVSSDIQSPCSQSVLTSQNACVQETHAAEEDLGGVRSRSPMLRTESKICQSQNCLRMTNWWLPAIIKCDHEWHDLKTTIPKAPCLTPTVKSCSKKFGQVSAKIQQRSKKSKTMENDVSAHVSKQTYVNRKAMDSQKTN